MVGRQKFSRLAIVMHCSASHDVIDQPGQGTKIPALALQQFSSSNIYYVMIYHELFSGHRNCVLEYMDDNLVGQLTACRVAPIKDKSCIKVSRQGAPPSVHVAFFQTRGLQEHQKNQI